MWQAIALVALFAALAAAGLLFVNHNLYKDFEGKDPVVQVTSRKHDVAHVVQQKQLIICCAGSFRSCLCAFCKLAAAHTL